MKKMFSIDVRGKTKEYSFNFWGDEQYWDEWDKEGLKISKVTASNIPSFVFYNKILRNIWCWLQKYYIIPME